MTLPFITSPNLQLFVIRNRRSLAIVQECQKKLIATDHLLTLHVSYDYFYPIFGNHFLSGICSLTLNISL